MPSWVGAFVRVFRAFSAPSSLSLHRRPLQPPGLFAALNCSNLQRLVQRFQQRAKLLPPSDRYLRRACRARNWHLPGQVLLRIDAAACCSVPSNCTRTSPARTASPLLTSTASTTPPAETLKRASCLGMTSPVALTICSRSTRAELGVAGFSVVGLHAERINTRLKPNNIIRWNLFDFMVSSSARLLVSSGSV